MLTLLSSAHTVQQQHSDDSISINDANDWHQCRQLPLLAITPMTTTVKMVTVLSSMSLTTIPLPVVLTSHLNANVQLTVLNTSIGAFCSTYTSTPSMLTLSLLAA